MYLRDDVPRRAETPITHTHIQNVGEGGGFLNSNLYVDRVNFINYDEADTKRRTSYVPHDS